MPIHAIDSTREPFSLLLPLAIVATCFVASASSLAAAEELWPLSKWQQAKPSDVHLDEAELDKARKYALTGGGSGYITRHGKLVMSWGDSTRRYDLKSTTKSIGVTALGLAIADGKISLTDRYVYIYSQDSDSAYQRSDRMVLARVPSKQIAQRVSYEFFQKLHEGNPVWTANVNQRGAVFMHQGACYRSSVSYNAALRRYLWCQTGAGSDTRFRGGLAIYDAPEPWGPWTTVFHAHQWDIGPGETSCLPTKWMSPDGCTVHLVFSGNDCFSVRKGMLLLRK